jgi:LPXTG-motif cell wall-anchored protein
VHEEPAATPDAIAPMTPLTGPGKAAHHPLGRPHRHVPRASGRAHRDCVRQGTGFVCPLGAAPHHRPHVLNLTSPTHPHTLHCVGANGPACHTRSARPVAVREQPAGGRLPATGGPSELLALSGLGLAGAGVVLYRLSRTRRENEGGE